MKFPLWTNFSLFVVGLLVGYIFHVIDRVCQLVLVPEFKEKKRHSFALMKKGQLLSIIGYIIDEVPSVSSSFYFLLLYFPLSFYLITSSGSVLGTGLMLGLGLSYCAHFVLSYKKVKHARALYFSQVSTKVRDAEIQKLMGGFILLFTVLSLLVLI